MILIDCIVVNYNQYKNCLNLFSLLEKETCVNKIICVDNSGDFDNFLNNSFKKLLLIKPNSNLGFGKANNLGVSKSSSERILICNPDIYFDIGSIDKINLLYNDLDTNDLGFCFEMKDSNGKIQYSHRRLLQRHYFLINQLGLSFILPEKYQLVYKNYSNLQFIDQPIGAFVFLNKKHFLSVDGFDDEFFVYYEDVYLFNKLNLKFNKMKYRNDISIYHKGGESSKNSIANMLQLQIEGKKIYFLKKRWKKMNKFYLLLEFILKVYRFKKQLNFSEIISLYKIYIN
jgi:GT2 family glycosyltransferase